MFEAVKRLEIFPRSGRIVPEIGQEDIREILFGSYRIVYVVGEELEGTFEHVLSTDKIKTYKPDPIPWHT